MLAALGIAFAVSACSSSGTGDPGQLGGGNGSGTGNAGGGGSGDSVGGGNGGGGSGDVADPSTPGPGGVPGGGTGSGADPNANNNPNMVDRKVDYGEALRSASLKLIGELPTGADIQRIATAANEAAQKTEYERQLDAMLASPKFSDRMIAWWRDTFRTGGPAMNNRPSFDTAATFAAMVVVQDRPYTDLFTATTGTCPTYANGTFTAANCAGGAPTAGVLTDPGLMSQYFANMAFRRVRFVQETFACSKFPAEYSKTPTPMGASLYTSPWNFNSISGGAGSRVDFRDTSSVICANCHTTMNHIAPLFANFAENGTFNANQIQVETPTVPPSRTQLTDFLPAGEQLAWRNGVTVTNLPSLGQAMANDPDVARCAVNRVWNWAMSRGDIVNDMATVPAAVTDPFVTQFTANGYKLKATIRAIFTSEDYVKF
jgi:hypothetical protein